MVSGPERFDSPVSPLAVAPSSRRYLPATHISLPPPPTAAPAARVPAHRHQGALLLAEKLQRLQRSRRCADRLLRHAGSRGEPALEDPPAHTGRQPAPYPLPSPPHHAPPPPTPHPAD